MKKDLDFAKKLFEHVRLDAEEFKLLELYHDGSDLSDGRLHEWNFGNIISLGVAIAHSEISEILSGYIYSDDDE